MLELLISILYECEICLEVVRDEHVTSKMTINRQQFHSGILYFFPLACVWMMFLMAEHQSLEAQTLLSDSITFSSPIEMWVDETIGFDSLNLLIYLLSTGKFLRMSFRIMTFRLEDPNKMCVASSTKASTNSYSTYAANKTLNQKHKSDIAFHLMVVQLDAHRIPNLKPHGERQ